MVEQMPETDARERREDEYGLDPAVVDAVREALRGGDREAIVARIGGLHVADIADLFEQIDTDERRALIGLAWSDIDAQVLAELEAGVRDDVLRILEPARVAEAARELETDDVVYLVEDLEEAERREVLAALDPADRVAVAQSLTYPEYSAGRLMQRDLVKAPPYWTVGQMIDWMRAAEDMPEQFYDVIVVDAAMKPVGTIPLSRVMASRRPVTLASLMEDDFRTIGVLDAQEDVAYAFNQYHLVSAPVVDGDGRLLGVITIDDAVEVMQEETAEDLLRLGGVGDEEISDTVWEIARRRVPWLGVNLVTAIAASMVIGMFEDQIAALVALAVLMPIVASMGGNAGTQTLTVAVRALATRDLTRSNAVRVIGREVAVGVANGLIFAIVMGAVAWVWFGDALLAAVIGVAMVIAMLSAGMSGILIPMALERMGADPALASGPFVTTVTDIVGFFAFLGLASIVLL
ncbi:MAG TPA: magnesium transporter [Paracoccaceae bacterium]|nr:magnesium transporter [Paracoccaceae bacterium]